MNQENNRKVLVSIKLSTLLLIITTVVAVIIGANIVVNKISSNTIEEISTAKIQENSLDEDNFYKERIINSNISSRSLGTSRNSNQEEHHQLEEIIEEQILNEAQEELPEEPEIITTPIEEVKISVNMDLTVRTGLSKEDFIILISGVKQDTSNFFKENASLIYDVCEKYQINEIFFCGLISAESGWTIAQNHRNTYNYISLMSKNGLIRYSSVEDGIEKAAQTLHQNYLTPGGCFYYGSTLAGMKTKFCPASSTWVNLVYQRMQQIMNSI